MGGDRGPRATVEGTARALHAHPRLSALLFGPRSLLATEVEALPVELRASGKRLEIHDAPRVIDQSMRLSQALRMPRDSSLAMMLDSVASGAVEAGVSAGNTGALMALARRALGTVSGIPRPAISTAVPTRNGGHCYLLDLGASVEAPARRLVDFALMGSVMARRVDGLAAPRIALLNIGVEGTKGNVSVREADALLRGMAGLDYRGFIEGGGIYTGQVDVVVCDGFVGNAVLKASEGLASMLMERVQTTFEAHWSSRLVGLLARPALRRLKRELDPVRYNGASLLGLKGIVVKSHGSAGAIGFGYAVKRAMQEVDQALPQHLASELDGWRCANVSVACGRDVSGTPLRRMDADNPQR